MLSIGWADYMKGRDTAYAEAFTLEIARNARRTIEVVNAVLAAMAADGVDLSGVHVASGWRPPAVNDDTANASHHSKHLTGEACDLADRDGSVRVWAVKNPQALERLHIWIEDPRWTGEARGGTGWLHLQTCPPASGKRCFIPSTAPASDPDFYARMLPHYGSAPEYLRA